MYVIIVLKANVVSLAARDSGCGESATLRRKVTSMTLLKYWSETLVLSLLVQPVLCVQDFFLPTRSSAFIVVVVCCIAIEGVHRIGHVVI